MIGRNNKKDDLNKWRPVYTFALVLKSLSFRRLGEVNLLNQRMMRAGKDVWRLSSPTLLSEQVHLEHVAQDSI